MTEHCICCGAVIPEGRQVCPNCEPKSYPPDAYLPDGTPLFMKTTYPDLRYNLQSIIYNVLFNHGKENKP